ncbi:MAG TPA: SUMF1/EgtB/PvdO family nonheme iron enzyme [Polyangium sp.]|nr:SUMF1/EgtB/PvdO family nonheme iron enzyme [Polyangium sp.]
MVRNISVFSAIMVGLVACGGAPEPVTAKTPAPVVAVANASNASADSAPAACEDQGAAITTPVVVASPAPVVTSNADKPADLGPSCNGRSGATNDCQGQSCCERLGVPGGVVAYRRDGNAPAESRAVKPFVLDKFEVTVGRFRAWVDAGQPTPKAGDVLYDDNTGHIVRWSKDAKVQDVKHLAGWQRYDTWTAGVETRPKNFVSWYTAAAFCAWDGGRLPTDVEWMYVARGGEEDRPYPWGAESATPEHAVFNCMGDGTAACALQDILPVGSKPKGIGRWGHFDLAGSMFEWTLQGVAATSNAVPVEKARGGGFCYIGGVDRRATTELRPTVFRQESPETVSHMTGFRCAYDLPAAAPTVASR